MDSTTTLYAKFHSFTNAFKQQANPPALRPTHAHIAVKNTAFVAVDDMRREYFNCNARLRQTKDYTINNISYRTTYIRHYNLE